jgi:transposase
MNRDHINNQLTLGVDTHLTSHVAVLINNIGQVVDTKEFPVCFVGYEKLYNWAQSFGSIKQGGLEGTGTYGAGLCKFLEDKGLKVFEVNRPNRAKRRLRGKSDPMECILATLVRMEHHTLWPASLLIRHIQCFKRQLCIRFGR